MPAKKKQTAIRFKPDTKRLLDLLQEDTGLTITGVIELAIRDLAKTRHVTLPPEGAKDAAKPESEADAV